MAKNMYAKGRKYEYQFVYKARKYGLLAKRVLLSGQRGEGDVILTKPLNGGTDGIVLACEVKARKSVPKVIYEWLGKHDLLVMKKIGQKYGWLVAMDLDLFLSLLAQLRHIPDTADTPPTHADEEDDGSTVL